MRRAVHIRWLAGLIAALGIGWYGRGCVEADEAPAEALEPALRTALSDGSASGRIRRLAQLFERLDAENIGEAAAVYDTEVWRLEESEIRPFVDAWVSIDAMAAVDAIRVWPTAKRPVGLEAAVRSWARIHPVEARFAVADLVVEYPAFKNGLIENFVVGWVHSGEKGVVEFVGELPRSLRSRAVIAITASQGQRLGAAGMLDWADDALGVTEGNYQLSLFRQAAGAATQENPELAAAWVERHAGRGYARNGVRIVAERWMPRDADATLDWVRAAGSDVAERDKAIRSAFSWWMQRDRTAAEQWLLGTELTALHDPAIDFYALALARRSEFQPALSWAERIQDETLRLSSLSAVATLWHRLDAAAAEVWLEQSPLDEEARRGVREPPPVRRRDRGGTAPRRAAAEGGPAADPVSDTEP
jgi:hypothetical protein